MYVGQTEKAVYKERRVGVVAQGLGWGIGMGSDCEFGWWRKFWGVVLKMGCGDTQHNSKLTGTQ